MDPDATEVVLAPVELTLNLRIIAPIALDITVDIGPDTLCQFIDVSATIPAL